MKFSEIEVLVLLGILLTLFGWLLQRNFSRTRLIKENNCYLHKKLSEQEQTVLELKQSGNLALETALIKSEFFANLSHEIRTPLGAIIGMSVQLLNTKLIDKQRQQVETIQTSSSNLINVLDDILDFSKIEAGQLRFENIRFELDYVLNGVIQLLAGSAKAKDLELISSIDKDVPIALCGDPGRLRQVLTNLISNAIKFTYQGSVEVRVTLKSETVQKATVHFAVRDTGIGIPVDVRQDLFNPFTQADSSITRQYGGTGLGLSISKHLVENMDGEIGVNFPDESGAEFWFTLCLEKQRKKLPAQLPFTFRAGLRGLRILVISGDEGSRFNWEQQMKSWNMQVFKADSTEQAMKILHHDAVTDNESFDFILVEEQLPDTDSFLFARTVKTAGNNAQTHLILLPSLTERGQGLLARESGFAAYLSKPVVPSQLFECLLNLVNGRFDEEVLEDSIKDTSFITRHRLAEIKQQTSLQMSLLIVEDNEINQDILSNMVELLGFDFDVVGNGYEALEALDKKTYQFVLMDCQMPGIDGYETTKRIRASESINKDVPIIAVTANVIKEKPPKYLVAGMNDYLLKPVDIEDLQFVLQRWSAKRAVNIADKTEAGRESDEDVPPVDFQRLRRVAGKTEEDLQKFINNYLREMSDNLSHLDDAVQVGSGEQTAYYAHSCIGISAVCGINLPIDTLCEIEDLAESGNLNAITELHTRIKTEFEEVKIYLKER